ncbi:MAG: NAD+ diphosphatase [Gammaproteobacteria bacterium]|jgi:NAD+ diphosphatase
MTSVQGPHVFSSDPLDRADRERRDEQWIEERLRDSTSRFLPFADMQVLVSSHSDAQLAWQDCNCLSDIRDGAEPVLLGCSEGVAHFAFDASGSDALPERIKDVVGLELEDPRGIATQLSLNESGLLAHAKALVDWHARHRFCANCGGTTKPRIGGKERRCTDCGAHHFPRTDPVAIMLVYDGDRCLLGRNARRVNKLYSALAGFVDQGECIEEAVRREVMEEAGIKVGRVDYHSSQPWPFPSSLMIGCIAQALSTDIVIDEHELADVRWFTREEVLEVFARGGDTEDGFYLPNPIAIAHHLIKDWATGIWSPAD